MGGGAEWGRIGIQGVVRGAGGWGGIMGLKKPTELEINFGRICPEGGVKKRMVEEGERNEGG